jgi:hypothetical protein
MLLMFYLLVTFRYAQIAFYADTLSRAGPPPPPPTKTNQKKYFFIKQHLSVCGVVWLGGGGGRPAERVSIECYLRVSESH